MDAITVWYKFLFKWLKQKEVELFYAYSEVGNFADLNPDLSLTTFRQSIQSILFTTYVPGVFFKFNYSWKDLTSESIGTGTYQLSRHLYPV